MSSNPTTPEPTTTDRIAAYDRTPTLTSDEATAQTTPPTRTAATPPAPFDPDATPPTSTETPTPSIESYRDRAKTKPGEGQSIDQWATKFLTDHGFGDYIPAGHSFVQDLNRQVAPTARKLSPWGVTAEELFNETFAHIFIGDKPPVLKFDPSMGNPLAGFISVLAQRKLANILRDKSGGGRSVRRLQTVRLTNEDPETAAGTGISESVLPGRDDNPAAAVEHNDFFGRIRDWLSESRLAPTMLKLFEGYIQAEQLSFRSDEFMSTVASITGFDKNQVSYYTKMLVDDLRDFAESSDRQHGTEYSPMIERAISRWERRFHLEKSTTLPNYTPPAPSTTPAAPKRPAGPRKAIWNSPTLGPVEVILRRAAETGRNWAIARADGQPFEGGKATIAVPKEQIQVTNS